MERKIDHALVAIESIDRTLGEPICSIEHALKVAVEKKRMTPEEANECLQAYWRTFNGELPDDAA